MRFSLENLETTVTHATHLEKTGLETITEEDLHLAFYRTVNEIVVGRGNGERPACLGPLISCIA